MAFWSDAAAEQKRGYRWLVTMGNMHQWIAKSVTKPSVTISETSHKFINHTFWYPGRVEWNSIDMTLVDPVTDDAVMTFMKLVEKAGYQVPDRIHSNWRTISKSAGVEAVNKYVIQQIDSNGSPIETWTLHNPWIKSVSFGNLSYDDDSIMNISVGLRYDWAYLATSNEPMTAMGVSGKKFPTNSPQANLGA